MTQPFLSPSTGKQDPDETTFDASSELSSGRTSPTDSVGVTPSRVYVNASTTEEA